MAWGVGNLHQTAAVEEEPCPSAVGSMSPGAVDLVEEEAFDRFGRLISVEAAVFDSELLCHRVGQFFETNGPVGGRGSQAGYEIKSIVLHFNLVFSLDQHQPSMIFSQSTQKHNMGSPGPGLAFENADISQISPKSNHPCMVRVCKYLALPG